MKPAIGDKDLLLYYRLQDSYTGGDVVVYEKRGVEMVGRIAAMPGETVEITKDGTACHKWLYTGRYKPGRYV